MSRKTSYFRLQPLQKRYPFCFTCTVVFLLMCVCVFVCVFDWQVSQQGHAGVRRVLGVCDVTGERHTHTHTYKKRQTHCDRWAEPFSCCLFQLVFGNCQKVSIKIFDDIHYHSHTHIWFCTLHDVKRSLIKCQTHCFISHFDLFFFDWDILHTLFSNGPWTQPDIIKRRLVLRIKSQPANNNKKSFLSDL